MNTKSKPIFSVVIPVYNVERYINSCLNSVLAQTFSNFEVICVNDGSTDHSVELINQYNDPRIHIVHQHNRGLAAARNTGINCSRGMYIALLDSDDFWKPEKLALHFKHLSTRSDIDISYSASALVDELGNDLGIGQFPQIRNITPQHVFCRNPVGNGSAAVMRRSLLMRLGRVVGQDQDIRFEYFDESLRQSEDIEFWLRAALDANATFEGIAAPLTCYRVNASGLSANLNKQFDFWKKGINKNRSNHPEFFNRWYPLAIAYQQRYLARRAIQSGNSVDALNWLKHALKSNWRIVPQEPGRTLITCCAAVCSLLPNRVYQFLQRLAMNRFGSHA